MEKLAIFVEGQTERLFVERLITAMAGHRHFHIDAIQAYGGGRIIPRCWEEIHATRPHPKTHYYILIYECTNDSRVLSDIREHYQTLADQQYHAIIGIRDVYPQHAPAIATIREDFKTYLPKTPLGTTLILAIMEIEAWFIGEHTHFARLHSALTVPTLTGKLGYDPSIHDVTLIPSPSNDLRVAYSLAGLSYNKSHNNVERTVRHLSFEEVYCNLRGACPRFCVN